MQAEKNTIEESYGENHKIKALIVEDVLSSRFLLRKILEKMGLAVIEAENGKQAITQYRKELPDIIFMDIEMPVMDGMEATKKIRKLAGDNFIPIIFLTASTEDKVFASCLDSGGDDFLGKPYSPVILKAKIKTLLRFKDMQDSIRQKNDLLLEQKKEKVLEMELGAKIISNITEHFTLDVGNVNYCISPMDILNGDVLLSAFRPTGEQVFLLGDFTGHGIASAIGSMTVYDVFFSMVGKGFPLEAVAKEINSKLKRILPVGRFLSSSLIEFNGNENEVKILNAGLPDILVRGKEPGVKYRISSQHLPLGIVNTDEISFNIEIIAVDKGDRVFVYSDGLIEAESEENNFYKQERVENHIRTVSDPDDLYQTLLDDLHAFVGTAAQTDDITILELICDNSLVNEADIPHNKDKSLPPAVWDLSLNIDAEVMRNVNPLPILMNMVSDLQGLEDHHGNLFTVLAEMYSNALEHGLLDLDSGLKKDAKGFAQYYELRQQRLDELKDARISFTFHHEVDKDQGKLNMCLKHNGLGFDHERIETNLIENETASGRGISLIRSICDEVNYTDGGNRLEVSYKR